MSFLLLLTVCFKTVESRGHSREWRYCPPIKTSFMVRYESQWFKTHRLINIQTKLQGEEWKRKTRLNPKIHSKTVRPEKPLATPHVHPWNEVSTNEGSWGATSWVDPGCHLSATRIPLSDLFHQEAFVLLSPTFGFLKRKKKHLYNYRTSSSILLN